MKFLFVLSYRWLQRGHPASPPLDVGLPRLVPGDRGIRRRPSLLGFSQFVPAG